MEYFTCFLQFYLVESASLFCVICCCIRLSAIVWKCACLCALFTERAGLSRMAKKQCGKCEQDINDLEPIRCGFCDGFFHISQNCCGINARGLKDAFSTGKIMYVCQICRDELNGRSIRRFMAEQQQHQTDSSPLASLPAQVREISDVVAALSKKIDDLSVKPQRNRSVSRSASSNTTVWPKLGMKRRREDRPDVDVAIAKGTRSINLSDLGGLSVPSIIPPAPPEKFWLYLSGLNPLITDNDMKNIVSRCLGTTDPVDVVRLVPKGKDTSTMTFLSFKIGLNPDVKSLALDSATWPNGLQFREFIQLPKN